jgi:hypothetical protein
LLKVPLLPLLQLFSTPPLPCDLSALPVVYKVEEGVDERK